MIKNVGMIDKIIRIVLAIVLIYLDFSEKVTGGFSWVLSVIAIVLLITAIIGHCPLYKLIGMNTCPAKKE